MKNTFINIEDKKTAQWCTMYSFLRSLNNNNKRNIENKPSPVLYLPLPKSVCTHTFYIVAFRGTGHSYFKF